jgi:ATP:ADP antiporter, AAA family
VTNSFDSPAANRSRVFLARFANIEPHELPAVAAAFGSMFLLLSAYMVLRPVRDSMGITAGFANLWLLQWGTFIGTLAAQPLFGWLTAHLRRTTLVPCVYLFFAANLVGFYFWFNAGADVTVLSRSFYIWMSVTNLIAVSLFWSLMVDVFRPEQTMRLFGVISGGASLGGIVGPLITRSLVATVGRVPLMLIAACALALAIFGLRYLAHWHARHGGSIVTVGSDANQPVGGSAWAGLRALVTKRSLLAIAIFMILLSWSGAVAYMEQMRYISQTVTEPAAQTQLFAELDLKVQIVSLIVQLFVFNRLVAWFGFTFTLLLIPVLLACGFIAIAGAPALVLVVMVMRRAGEYAITRPCRELLFAKFDRETKYKAKNALDSFVFRVGDATGGSIYRGLLALGLGSMALAWVGAGLAAIWAVSGLPLGRIFKRANEQRAL